MSDKKPRRGMNCLKHRQFYEACECLKKHKQFFLDARPTKEQTAEKLSGLVGFKVPPATVPNLQETTGIKWAARWSRSENPRGTKAHAIRTLSRAVARLFDEFKMVMPDSLIKLLEEFDERDEKPEQQNILPLT